MPTQINFTIKKDGTGDYTSIKSFVVAEGKDLVTDDENHFVTIHGAGWDSTTPLSETFIDFASYTTDVTRNVTFFVQTADRHNYTAGSGFVFTISTSFGLVLRSKYIILDGFEIANTTNTANLFDTSTNATLKNSLVHDVDYAQFAGDGEFNLHYNYASRGGFANTFYNGGTLLNITCIQLGAEGGFTGDIGIANANCTNVVLYTDKVTGSFSNYYLCTGDYNAINKAGENVPGANSFETVVTGDFVDFVAENYTSKLGGSLEVSGLAGTFIGAVLESSSGVTVTALLNSNYMVEYNMKKNVASQSIGAQMTTISDGSDFSGAVSVDITKDNGTKTAGAGAVVHEGGGYHSYTPTQAETNGEHLAFSFSGAGALSQTIQTYTSFPQSVDNDVKVSLIPTTPMRGTDSANTVVPPSLAEFNARTIPSADYFVVTDYSAPDNASIGLILGDTNELQINQGNWLTATGFSTFDHNTDQVIASNMRGTDGANTVTPDNTSIVANGIKIDDLENISVAQVFSGGDVDSYSLEESLKLMLAANVGILSGAATNSIIIKAADGNKTRLTASVDADGNRTSVTKDATG